MAARTLAAGGARVGVLEARTRVGGRIYTKHAPMPVELGAEFVHGLPGMLWNLLREGGLEVHERRGAHLRHTAHGLRDSAEGPEGYSLIERMQRWYLQQPPGTDLSFAQFLRLMPADEASRRAALAYVEGFNAADAERIGVQSLVEQQRAEDAVAGDRIFHLSAGYDALPAYLARRLEQAGGVVHSGHVVSEVNWGPGRVQCRGARDDGRPFSFVAPQAVVTLPVGVLQSGQVSFTPPPDPIPALAGRMAMGAARRFTLVFRQPFWLEAVALTGDARPLSFLFAPCLDPPTWWTPAPDPWPCLTGWVGGSRAARFPVSWLERSLDTLAAIFRLPAAQLRELLVSSHYHDWSADRFAGGAYSYVPVGAVEASRDMTLPVQQTLFFAGEHADTTGEWGTVHGALRSGMRAAMQIMQSGRPASQRGL
jgi:monoamine oxidase